MGFFSWSCERCDKSLLSPMATNPVNVWMTDVVALLPNGSKVTGIYDGYGNVDGTNVFNDGEPQVYHRACWELAGSPAEFISPSQPADDQGWFFDEDNYQLTDPRSSATNVALSAERGT